jgi:hypothetical protein
MTQTAAILATALPRKAYLTGSPDEPSFAEWAVGCLYRIGALEDRSRANAWFRGRVDDQRRKVYMSALFPGQNYWDRA